MVSNPPTGENAPFHSPSQEGERGFSKRTLVIGYGNPDRQDDGAAWHVLDQLAKRADPKGEGIADETFQHYARVDLFFSLQLVPEMADQIAEYDRVLFVDAHTGAQPNDLHWEDITPALQNSPFTHHMTPQTLLSFVETLYGRKPEAILVAIRGFEFGFGHSLSEKTRTLVDQAAHRIWQYLS